MTEDYFGLVDKWIETAPGESTHYHDLGEGVPVVFIHGSGSGVSAAANWWLNLPELSKHMRTIALDLAGFGQTRETPETELGIDGWVAHVSRLLDALEIDKAWLVGNSLGGWVALQMALDLPDRVLGVVSMGTGGAQRTAKLKAHSAPATSREGVRHTLEDFVVDTSLVTDELVEARYRATAQDGAEERYRRVLAARERDREHHPLDLERLRLISLPVLLIHGRDDSVIPARWTLTLAEALTGADIHLFASCGHWSQVEKAEEFNELVAGFIARRSTDLGT